ncbi:unnamed protein product [Lota lota]
MPCAYRYEDHGEVPQLSVQWRGPPGRGLLCHYIKHKAFQNCSRGYSLSYRPGSILLTIQQVQAQDYGTHVCSVSKRHDVSDNSIHLAMRTERINEGQSSSWHLPGMSAYTFTVTKNASWGFSRLQVKSLLQRQGVVEALLQRQAVVEALLHRQAVVEALLHRQAVVEAPSDYTHETKQ